MATKKMGRQGEAAEDEIPMENEQTPRNREGEPPTQRPGETATRLDQKADDQEGEANRARTEEKAREARESTGRRGVHFGG